MEHEPSFKQISTSGNWINNAQVSCLLVICFSLVDISCLYPLANRIKVFRTGLFEGKNQFQGTGIQKFTN